MLQYPLISIIVPVYNVEEHFEKCLDSILSQSYQNIEVILVNDGSTDKSGQICNSYSERDKRIIVIHQKNEGAAMARCNGYNASSGKYIYFIDGDDYIDLNTIQILYDNLVKSGADIVVGQFCDDYDGYLYVPERAVYGEFTGEEIISLLKTNYLYDYKTQIAGVQTGLCSRLYKREILEGILDKGKGLWMGEDAICNLNIILRAKKLVVLHDVLYYYVRHKNEATMKAPDILWSGYIDFWNAIRDFDEEHYFKDQLPLRMVFYTNRIVFNSFDYFRSHHSYTRFLKQMRKEPIIEIMVENNHVNSYYKNHFFYENFKNRHFNLIYFRLLVSHSIIFKKIKNIINAI